MDEAFSMVGLSVALLLPWFTGAALVATLLRPIGANASLVIGYGYLLGMFLVSLLMRLLDMAGLATDFVILNVILLAVSGVPLLRDPSADACFTAIVAPGRMDEPVDAHAFRSAGLALYHPVTGDVVAPCIRLRHLDELGAQGGGLVSPRSTGAIRESGYLAPVVAGIDGLYAGQLPCF